MSAHYIYFISSLPMLQFEAKLPFTFEKFIESSQGLIPEDKREILINLQNKDNHSSKVKDPILKQWYSFDTALRNTLVEVRAIRKHISPEKYLRPEDYREAYMMRIALSARRNVSLFEAEQLIDQARWRFLDRLSTGHYFDFEYLLTYALKLLILERWEKVRSADKERLLEEVLKG